MNPLTAENQEQYAPWSVLAVVLLAGLAGTLNYYKVPPVMPLLIKTFHVDRGTAGLLMSIFAVAGIILSIPGGVFLERFHGRVTGTLAVGFIVAGSALGAFSTHFGFMLMSRLMEGVGMALIAVVAPMVIAFRFGSKKRAIALGIFGSSFPLASAIVFITAPLLAIRWGWQSVWWCGSLYALIAGILYLSFVTPLSRNQTARIEADVMSKSGGRKALANMDVWLIGAIFFCFSVQFSAFLTWTPTFLFSVRGASLTDAALLMSVLPIFGIASALLSGWILARVIHRRLMCAIAAILFSVLLPWVSILKTEHLIPLMATIGFTSSMVPAVMMAVLADLSQIRKSGSAPQALVNMGQNAGVLLGPIVFGAMTDIAGGWSMAYWLLLPIGLAGGRRRSYIALALSRAAARRHHTSRDTVDNGQVEDRPGAERCFVGGKPVHQRGHLLRFAEPSHGNTGRKELMPFTRHFARHLGFYDGRGNVLRKIPCLSLAINLLERMSAGEINLLSKPKIGFSHMFALG